VLPAIGAARDGLAAGVAIMQLIARTGSPLSELAGGLPRYGRRRSTLPCAGHELACAAIEAVAAHLGAGDGEPDPEEGLRVERDGAWALVRQSATEPVLRLTVEAPSQAAADDLHDELRAALREAAAT
jgi:phosphomannomutase